MWYPINGGVATIYGQQLESHQSYLKSTKVPKAKENLMVQTIEEAPQIGVEKNFVPVETMDKIKIGGGV